MQKTRMTQVGACSMSNCCYNMGNSCHTLGIMVGSHAECNSFIHGSRECGFNEAQGGVGTCMTSDCKFNERLMCTAPDIAVTSHNEHADCKTFQPKM